MKNKILIYDDNCPFCCWYSNEFVRFGFLQENGRTAFSKLDPGLFVKIDFEKSRHEIPLLDTVTGKVFYGIDALLEILDTKIPFMKKTGNIKPVKWFLQKLYNLISYNRKVIVAKKCGSGSIDCTPDINYFYRFNFMAICLLFNTIMLIPLHNYVLSGLVYYQLSIAELQAAYFIFVSINCTLAFTLTKEKGFEYMGQVNMLALTANLLIVPLLFLNFFYANTLINSFYLLFTALFIFKEYIRRMDFAGVLLKHKWLVSLNLLTLTAFVFYLFH